MQYIVVEGNSWGNEFGNASLYDAFHEFRVFQLVAYCHAVARFYELRKIGIDRMIRKTRQFTALGAVVAVGEHNVEGMSGFYGIFTEGFVEIAYPKQQ